MVLDGEGQPVRGLTAADFTLLDEGKPQTIAAFVARERTPPGDDNAQSEASPARNERVATNAETATRSGAFFAVLIDDLGLTPAVAEPSKAAIGRWLSERADPRDEVTLLTTSGDVWWSDEVGTGREDLRAALQRVRGKSLSRATRGESMTTQEAYQISAFEAHNIGDERIAPTGEINDPRVDPRLVPPEPKTPAAASVLERVAKRWLDEGTCCWCSPTCLDCPPLRKCKARIQMMAGDVYGTWMHRAETVLGAVERVATGLSGVAGRKSIVLVSESFLRDRLIEDRYRRVVDAAQRSNTAVYFASALGLGGHPGYGMEVDQAQRAGDLGRVVAEEKTLAIGGAEHLADATGGTVTVSNDLALGLDRMAADASAYYLLGYQPEGPLDGNWHDVVVKVARKGVTVRARRGYLATVAPPEGAALARKGARDKGGKAKEGASAALSSPDLLAGSARGAIPLRMASYLQGPDGAGSARVLVVVEVDGARVLAQSTAAGKAASLGLTILAVARDRDRVAPLAQTLDLKLGEKDVGGWWALFREVRLPPGVSQIRALVRDKATGALGSVRQRIEIPDVDAPYLSTPLITDRTQPPQDEGEPARLVPTASRRFPAKGSLFCQYEVFSFGGQMMPGASQVLGGYTLQREGEVVAMVPPTPIASDGSRVVRRLVLPAEELAPGAYDLTVTVEDRLGRRTLSARESFVVEAE